MKNIRDIYDIGYDLYVKDIKINSKEVEDGDLFVCVKGVNEDRHNYINEALNNGAKFVVCSKEINDEIPHVKVPDTNLELAVLSKKFYDYRDSLKIIGVTGTDGKTTTSTLIRTMLTSDKCAYIGTNGISGKNFEISSSNTTPEINVLYKYFKKFEDENLEFVAMEASSEAFFRNRLNGIKFDIGILTNITRDHLNVHKTLSNYIDCKCELFRNIKKDGVAILNRDDTYFDKVRENCSCRVLTYGKGMDNDLVIKEIVPNIDSTSTTYLIDNSEYTVNIPLLGEFNAYNLAGAILTLFALGMPIEEVFKRVENIERVAGRMNIFKKDNTLIVLDYAHTPNALKVVLKYLNRVKKKRIITVVGSAGGREHEKRPLMGEVCQKLSDLVIYTKDDPRYEDPKEIIAEMIDYSKDNYFIEVDREKAIVKALELSSDGDIILVAGKGIDKYMLENGEEKEYSDYEFLKKLTDK